jgi:hypothetical protein
VRSWDPEKVVTASNFLEYIQTTRHYQDQLVHSRVVPAREARTVGYVGGRSPRVVAGGR